MRLIFHIPLKIDRNDPSASQIRPQKLMKAFADLGWEMDVVEGSGRDRKQQIAKIKRKIRQGVHYDFVYSESSTMPTLLTEPHHLPIYPCLDFGFLSFCKRHGIPWVCSTAIYTGSTPIRERDLSKGWRDISISMTYGNTGDFLTSCFCPHCQCLSMCRTSSVAAWWSCRRG